MTTPARLSVSGVWARSSFSVLTTSTPSVGAKLHAAHRASEPPAPSLCCEQRVALQAVCSGPLREAGGGAVRMWWW